MLAWNRPFVRLYFVRMCVYCLMTLTHISDLIIYKYTMWIMDRYPSESRSFVVKIDWHNSLWLIDIVIFFVCIMCNTLGRYLFMIFNVCVLYLIRWYVCLYIIKLYIWISSALWISYNIAFKIWESQFLELWVLFFVHKKKRLSRLL